MIRRHGVLCLIVAGCLLAGGMITPARADGDTTYGVTVDYLYWTTHRGEMDYWYPEYYNPGSVETVDPESDGGFRFGFEMTRGQATYMIGFTTYSVEEEGETDESGSGTLIIDDVCAVCQWPEFSAAGYDLDYSVITLGVGYQLRPDSDFGLQFLGGLVYASTEEEFSALYSDDASITGYTDVVAMENEMEAFGFNIGLVPSYKFNDVVSLFGRLNYSPMMADIDRSFLYEVGDFGTSGMNTAYDVEIDETEIAHKVDFAVGVEIQPIDWMTVSIGYESETWLNYPAFLKLTSESGEETIDRGGDGLAFDGGFLRLGFEF